MSRDAKLYLEDIIEAGNNIQNYLLAYDYDNFSKDQRTIDAVIRNFEVIGEAVKHLPSAYLEREPLIPWKAIAGFRDILAHAYFSVEEAIVWNAATEHLPTLLAACRRLNGE